jgi:hypothetical protein
LWPPTVFVGRNCTLVSTPLLVTQLFLIRSLRFRCGRSAPLDLLRVSSFLSCGLALVEFLTSVFSRILAHLDSPLVSRRLRPLLPHRSILAAAGFSRRLRFWSWFSIKLCAEPSFPLVAFFGTGAHHLSPALAQGHALDCLCQFSAFMSDFRSQLLALIFPSVGFGGCRPAFLRQVRLPPRDFDSCPHRFWSAACVMSRP